jgi:hypothetical protein
MPPAPSVLLQHCFLCSIVANRRTTSAIPFVARHARTPGGRDRWRPDRVCGRGGGRLEADDMKTPWRRRAPKHTTIDGTISVPNSVCERQGRKPLRATRVSLIIGCHVDAMDPCGITFNAI